jgi:uncharacterized membrane protein YsdA (DUF1294 family)
VRSEVLFIALFFLTVLNATAFAMMAWDKSASQNGMRRIPEANLLFIALIGGSVGAVLGQQMLRHKTRKEPFQSILFGIVALHASVVSYFAFRQLL